MANVRIFDDSTCDLSPALVEKYGLTIVPLYIVMDDQSYKDGVEATPEKIFTWAEANKTTPKTAAPSPDLVTQALKPAMEAGDEAIFFTISAQMSTTYNVVRLAAEDLGYDRLHIVDSKNLSTGIGLQVLKAAEMAQAGKSAQEIVTWIEGHRDLVRASFVVDTLTYLARGGRCNAVTAFVGNALKLHPKIVVKDGAMGVSKKYVGGIQYVLGKYVRDMEKELKNADPSRVFITHSGCSEDTLTAMWEYLRSLNHFDEILETTAGGVISSHCGPKTLGVLFYAKEN